MESTPLSSLIAATFDENDTRALVGSVENNCGFVCVCGVCGGCVGGGGMTVFVCEH